MTFGIDGFGLGETGPSERRSESEAREDLQQSAAYESRGILTLSCIFGGGSRRLREKVLKVLAFAERVSEAGLRGSDQADWLLPYRHCSKECVSFQSTSKDTDIFRQKDTFQSFKSMRPARP